MTRAGLDSVAAALAARLREERANVARVVDEIQGALARLGPEPQDTITVHGLGGLLHDMPSPVSPERENLGC